MAGDEDVKVAVTEAVTEEVTEVSTQAVYEDNPYHFLKMHCVI